MRLSVTCATLVLGMAVTALAAPGQLPPIASPGRHSPATPPESVMVRIRIRRNYPVGSIAEYVSLARTLPRRTYTVAEPLTVHQLIFDQYNLAIGNGAKAAAARSGTRVNERLFDSLSVMIAADNPGVNLMKNVVPAGELVLPSLPAKATWGSRRYFAAGSAINVSNEVLFMDSTLAGEPRLRFSENATSAFSDEGPSELVDLFVTLRAAEARALVAISGADGAVSTEMVDAPIAINAPHVSTGPPDTSGMSRALLVRAAYQQIPVAGETRPGKLVIFDLGWPSPDEALRSCVMLRGWLSAVAASWRVAATPIPCTPVSSLPHEPKHPKLIEQALASFRSVMPGAVDVVYVPFIRDRLSEPLLQEIVRLGQLIEAKTAVYNDPAGRELKVRCRAFDVAAESVRACAPLADTIPGDTTVRAFARDIVRLLPDSLPPDESDYRIQGLVLFFKYFSGVLSEVGAATKTGIVLNTSWTANPGDNARLQPPPGDAGVVVTAAAGNQGVTVTANTLDLARWGYLPSTVIAVFNQTDRKPTDCETNVLSLDQSVFPRMNGVGYTGLIGDGQCATSMSAPRVGWVLAARESRRTGQVPADWVTNIMSRLFLMRPTGNPAYEVLAFDPVKYLTAK